MPTLNGACPGCGQALTLELTVRTAPRGFARDSKPVQVTTDNKAPASIAASEAESNAFIASVNHDRPTCPLCGADGRRLEQIVKKDGKNRGRRFTAYTCGNEEGAEGCSAFGDTIPGTFRWTHTKERAA